MRTASAPGHHDVDAVCGPHYRDHLVVVIGIDEPGPEMTSIGVSLGWAAVFQRPDGLPGMLEKKLTDVLLPPAALV